MKHIIFIIVFFCAAVCSFAQFKKNDWELRWNASAGKYDAKAKTVTEGWTDESNLASNYYLNGSLSAGYYIIDGVSVEGELSLYAPEGASLQKYLLMNLSYSYFLPKTGAAAFVHAGYGKGNSFLFPATPESRLNSYHASAWGVSVINVGAGLKHLMTKNVAVTLEFNYRNQSYDETHRVVGNEFVVTTFTLNTLTMLFGISLLL